MASFGDERVTGRMPCAVSCLSFPLIGARLKPSCGSSGMSGEMEGRQFYKVAPEPVNPLLGHGVDAVPIVIPAMNRGVVVASDFAQRRVDPAEALVELG